MLGEHLPPVYSYTSIVISYLATLAGGKMQFSNEKRSISDLKSSKKYIQGYAPVAYKDSKEIFESGVSYRKIPALLFNLKERFNASSVDILVALFLAEHSISEGEYPNFIVGRSKIAQKTGLSPRAISNAIKFLSSNKVFFVRSSRGHDNQYTWNEALISSDARDSLPVVNEVHYYQCTTFTTGSERGAHFYIELSLEFFRTILDGYFDINHPEYKPFTFYIPGKRKKKNDAATMAAGSTRIVDRWEAWEEAAWNVWNEIKHQNNALTRLFFSLIAKNVESVNFPEAALRFRVNDAFTQHEARSRSHLNLYCDEDVIEFLNAKYGKGENQ